MTALQKELPQFEAPTADAMSRVCMMFQIATDKVITPEEGFQFLNLWNMIAKPAAAASVLNAAVTEPAQAPAAEITAPAKPSPSAPQSVASSAPVKPAPVIETPAPVAEVMPNVEEISVPGVAQPMRRLSSSFKSISKRWTEGYNWRISVEPFDRDSDERAYYIHYQEKPTQAEFDEHHARYTAEENRCSVHIMESDGTSSRRITDEYCSFRERADLNFHSKETLRPSAEWEEGSRFRARFSDRRLNGQINYIYYPNKPTQSQVDSISFAKGCVIIETRPKAEND